MNNPLKTLGRLICAAWNALRGRSAETVTATHHPDGGPARILLMRHAEKTGKLDDLYLSKAGVKRAQRLATYIPETFGKPDFVFAAAQSRRSVRSIETMKPLAAALGTEVDHEIQDKDFGTLITEIFSNPDYRGKIIAICWHHGKLPEIAALVGAPAGSYPDPWPQDVFNLIIDCRYDAKSDRAPVVTQVVEPF